MLCWILKVSTVIKQFFEKMFKSFIFVFALLFFFTTTSEAQLEIFQNDDGVEFVRSLESLRDLDYQTWQLVVYPNETNKEHLILRIVGFTGSLRLNHSKKLKVRSGIKEWDLEDITLKNSQLVNDNREAAAEFKLGPLLKDLENNRPLRLFLVGGFSELPVPPYVVNEWRSITSSVLNNEK